MRHGFAEQPSKTDVWLTPPWLLDALGPFDLDPCASIDQPWKTAARMLTVRDLGSMAEWHGRVWLNPPYGKNTEQWMTRLADHGDGIALVNSRVDTRWFHDQVFARADAVVFMRGRLRFHLPDGTQGVGRPQAGSSLIAYGRANAIALREVTPSPVHGAYIQLNQSIHVIRSQGEQP